MVCRFSRLALTLGGCSEQASQAFSGIASSTRGRRQPRRQHWSRFRLPHQFSRIVLSAFVRLGKLLHSPARLQAFGQATRCSGLLHRPRARLAWRQAQRLSCATVCSWGSAERRFSQARAPLGQPTQPTRRSLTERASVGLLLRRKSRASQARSTCVSNPATIVKALEQPTHSSQQIVLERHALRRQQLGWQNLYPAAEQLFSRR